METRQNRSLEGNFFKIANDAVDKGDLTAAELGFLAMLSRYNPSFPSYVKIKEKLNIGSDETVTKYIRSLESKGYITYEKGNSRKKANQYKIITARNKTTPEIEVVKSNYPKNRGSTTPEIEVELPQKSKSNNTKRKILNNKSKNRRCAASPPNAFLDSSKEIIGYLNQKARKNFDPDEMDNLEPIANRLAKGSGEDKLRLAIDNAIDQWTGDFSYNINPSTIFGKSFENLLNARGAQEKKKTMLEIVQEEQAKLMAIEGGKA